MAVALLLLMLGLPTFARANLGPYNVKVLADGVGVERALSGAGTMLAADAAYSFAGWIRVAVPPKHETVVMALGDPSGTCRCLVLRPDGIGVRDGLHQVIARSPISPGEWTHIAVRSDGRQLTIAVNGKPQLNQMMRSSAVSSKISLAPVILGGDHFGGSMVHATVYPAALSSAEIAEMASKPPDFAAIQMWDVGVGWSFQRVAQTGLWQPQDPWTLPTAKAKPSRPLAKNITVHPSTELIASDRWQINGWRMALAGQIGEDGDKLSRPGLRADAWYVAKVPGTVLQTLVDRGVYPDPYIGLNNLQIPEKLARQDYWFRTSFKVPATAAGRQLTLVFKGVNYSAEIWANGRRLGEMRGAFVRGEYPFDPVAGENVIAVRVSPPAHPGIPHEQSIAAGPGKNGGQMAIDGPTFAATEGWDWIPGIRDRNTGLWRPVELVAHGAIRIRDPFVVTDLPLPRLDAADLYVVVPIENDGPPVKGRIRVSLIGATLEKTLTIPSGRSEVRFGPQEHGALRVVNPELWWPNGYGAPTLHNIKYEVATDNGVSDQLVGRFGIREVSYDLSLFDAAGRLRRVNVQTTDGRLSRQQLVATDLFSIKETPRGWTVSLTPAGEVSPAVVPAEALDEPHLAIRVNGVRIAVRGGNWGIDDAMKGASPERLRYYFRLQREANLNAIRNWMGNSNGEEFFHLADENGIMVLNDFWQSTQNYQVEPEDIHLFLENARDTVSRFRGHPSIVLWIGRNEGVPAPALNAGLKNVTFDLDGSRLYLPSSNRIALQDFSTYDYRRPEEYFTTIATGFTAEVGTPSLATLESIQRHIPREDRWPIGDSYAYHDWHAAGNGDVKTFNAAMETMFGRASSLEDYERKAQLMNLETHKALFEGFNANLWTKNSGRLLWMSHPAWPSNMWQLYSWDTDTSAAYYGAKKGTEPIHVQLNLPGNELAVINTTREALPGVRTLARVLDLAGQELFRREDTFNVPANQPVAAAPLPLDELMAKHGLVLISLKLTNSEGRLLDGNFYWRGPNLSAYRALTAMPLATVAVTTGSDLVEGGDRSISIHMKNCGTTPALAAKLVLLDKHGSQILPAFFQDNYFSLLAGEERQIMVKSPTSKPAAAGLRMRGWNLPSATFAIQPRTGSRPTC